MRITNSFKYFILFLLGLAAVVALGVWFIEEQPRISKIIGQVLLILFACFIVYVTVQPIITSLGERADGILAVYPDASGRALHIFSYFLTSAEGMPSTRHIQYYVLLTGNRKLLYKVLFTHSMESLTGRSGYEGYSSFEETVLNNLKFKAAIAAFSAKAGFELQLGKPAAEGENDSYPVLLNGYTYSITSKERVVRDVMTLKCTDAEGKVVWEKSI